jgi:hypothetical protein
MVVRHEFYDMLARRGEQPKQSKKNLIVPHHTLLIVLCFALLLICRLIKSVPDESFCSN